MAYGRSRIGSDLPGYVTGIAVGDQSQLSASRQCRANPIDDVA